jgi:hypothetical protein
MAEYSTLYKIRLALRRSHTKLDEDLQADIDACLADLRACGVIHASEDDPLIYNAIKLYCRSLDTDDPTKAAEWLRRYEALKSCLMMAEGYGWKDGTEEAGGNE